MRIWARAALGGLVLAVVVSRPLPAQEPTCPLAGEKPMLVTQMFFGLSVPNGRPVTPAAWRRFVRLEVTTRFPEGFTVTDGQGQWLDTATHTVVRERSKIIIIAAADSAEVRARLTSLANAFRKMFHQQSVGMISSRSCADF